MAERRYALTQLGPGRYLLHGNDVEATMPGGTGVGTMFLLGRWEDGPALDAERRRTVWTLSCAPWAEVRRAIEHNVYGDPKPDPHAEWCEEHQRWHQTSETPRPCAGPSCRRSTTHAHGLCEVCR